MISDLKGTFSQISNNNKRSAIREILKLTQNPEIISFAGGLPAPESFPVDALDKIVSDMLCEEGAAVLQYDATEGVTELRELLLKKYQDEGIQCSLDNMIITTGSQQGLDLVGKIFVNQGDVVICGLPSYLGGIGAFQAYGATMAGVPMDEQGMSAELLETKLEELKQQGIKPKFIYVIPDFQNPTGITMPESRRLEIIALAHKYDVLIVEDCPYREVRFEGKPQRMMYELDNNDHVITLGTFSKIFAPGFRIGWVLGPKDVNEKIVIAKQSADLCTPTFVQKIAIGYMKSGLFETNLQKTIDLYHQRRDVMLAEMDKHMPDCVKWTRPEGGMFLFITLPEHMDALDLFHKAIEKKVAFVTGNVFYCDGSGTNTIRLNFSYVNNEKAIAGIQRLADIIKAEMLVGETC
ncbi:PLP-dependent aminotransferase family protein [Ancylomarina euxinus]|uniref:PLP-dependent aminotransferase family protein n=1 Tax=Ancylomarina euxinus TaxID=2283627 RepID=A0A425Y8Q1_9BACT|nr:PLP-dependent aminotransferase family protein [Ancylomarina euxinus]MCZ4693367.1 PLP-dependent aminotransferase family protein [Ancylomarina euxinus]MUP13595.1 aminotransferase class I/II-fold pyridoxal phosphate-dependent enzyme [Ancylomarina euxinus]RRG24873.1 PLP-dependent aminotransferase family protein [Ancylomarina euxinus]